MLLLPFKSMKLIEVEFNTKALVMNGLRLFAVRKTGNSNSTRNTKYSNG